MAFTRQTLREAALTVAMAVGVFLAVQAWQTRDASPRWQGPPTLAWVLPDGTQGRGTLQDLRAQLGIAPQAPIALHVWAAWCSICRAEEGTVTALGREYAVITLATRSGDAQAVERYLRERRLPWVTLLDPGGAIAAAHGWRAVPVFSVLTADGALRHTTVGYTTGWGMRLRLWWARP
ncbi:redoxin domain-containing protein [Tepidimonas taiwanensis]|uniref:redoxin domain-containing protein n=1 Tax=Tepidimonas taiwanensis TaxID=307486 RepID=UPI000734EB6A|nr:redoxin domain-containing protein [Tepidimonas taiwanensis]